MSEEKAEIKFEVGKTYTLSPMYKKSFVESEFFSDYSDKKTNRIVEVCVCWRSGSYNVTPQNEEEVEILQSYYDDEEPDSLCVTDFEEIEFLESWDGCSEDYYFHGDWDEEEKEAFEEELYEGWYYDILTEKEFDSSDCECYINGELHVEEYTGYSGMEVDTSESV